MIADIQNAGDDFCERNVNDQQFPLLKHEAYVADAKLTFQLLARVMLADTAPVRIRSSRLDNYVDAAYFRAAYHCPTGPLRQVRIDDLRPGA